MWYFYTTVTKNKTPGRSQKSNKRDLETSILGHLGSILRLLAPSWLYHVSYTTKCDHTWSKCGVFIQLSPKTRPHLEQMWCFCTTVTKNKSKCGVFVQLSPKMRPQGGAGTARTGAMPAAGGRRSGPLEIPISPKVPPKFQYQYQ